MENSEILAVSKILLESRAFTKEEISGILDKMVIGCVPRENMKLVSGLIANEKYHYVELHNKSHIKDKLWGLGVEISQCNLLEIVYRRLGNEETSVKGTIWQVAALFSEYYFYLNAYIMEMGGDGRYKQKYSYPAVFRIDRIQGYREIGEKFRGPMPAVLRKANSGNGFSSCMRVKKAKGRFLYSDEYTLRVEEEREWDYSIKEASWAGSLMTVRV